MESGQPLAAFSAVYPPQSEQVQRHPDGKLARLNKVSVSRAGAWVLGTASDAVELPKHQEGDERPPCERDDDYGYKRWPIHASSLRGTQQGAMSAIGRFLPIRFDESTT